MKKKQQQKTNQTIKKSATKTYTYTHIHKSVAKTQIKFN